MKKLILIALLGLTVSAHAQTLPASKPNPEYDAALAQKLGADDYGMHKYVIAFLKTGPVKIDDKAKLAEIQKAHLRNIGKLADAGKLVVAGPFMDEGDVEGIFIFDTASVDEARALTNTDPAIKAGVLVMELRPFYCSAALIEVAKTHRKLAKKNFAD